jgi:hypothetical protein
MKHVIPKIRKNAINDLFVGQIIYGIQANPIIS